MSTIDSTVVDSSMISLPIDTTGAFSVASIAPITSVRFQVMPMWQWEQRVPPAWWEVAWAWSCTHWPWLLAFGLACLVTAWVSGRAVEDATEYDHDDEEAIG